MNIAEQDSKIWFDTLYEQHSKALWYYLLKILRNANQAEDVFQETFYRIWRVKPQGLQPAQEKVYLFKIGTRIVIDMKRKEKRFGNYFVNSDFQSEEDSAASKVPFDYDLEPHFDQMTVKERTLLWLAYVEEYNHKDIAKIVGANEGTIKVMLFRAKQKLISLLEEEKK